MNVFADYSDAEFKDPSLEPCGVCQLSTTRHSGKLSPWDRGRIADLGGKSETGVVPLEPRG